MLVVNYQFDEGPKGPKLSWDNTSEMSKCGTGNCIRFTALINGSIEMKVRDGKDIFLAACVN